MRVQLNTAWVAAALVVPLLTGLAVAMPLWLRRVGDDMGSVLAAGIILLSAVAFVAREYGEVEAITRRCVQRQIGCRFEPTPFMRYALYAGIGMGQVFAVFMTGLWVEERLRRRRPETAS